MKPLTGSYAFIDAWAEIHGVGAVSDFSATFRADRGGPNARCDYVMVRDGGQSQSSGSESGSESGVAEVGKKRLTALSSSGVVIRPTRVFLVGGLREGVKTAASGVKSSVPGKPPPVVPSDHKAVVADLEVEVEVKVKAEAKAKAEAEAEVVRLNTNRKTHGTNANTQQQAVDEDSGRVEDALGTMERDKGEGEGDGLSDTKKRKKKKKKEKKKKSMRKEIDGVGDDNEDDVGANRDGEL